MKINKLYTTAVSLRRKGYSFSEISEHLGISKSTVSVWLRHIPLSARATERLKRLRVTGTEKGLKVIKSNRDKIDLAISQKAGKDFVGINLGFRHLRLLVAILYWAEGSKGSTGVRFTNSDPVMIKTFIELFNRSFKLEQRKWSAILHFHEYHNDSKQRKYWSNLTGIAEARIGIYRKPHTGINKREGYPGCIQIRYADAKLFKYIKNLYNNLAVKYGGVV